MNTTDEAQTLLHKALTLIPHLTVDGVCHNKNDLLAQEQLKIQVVLQQIAISADWIKLQKLVKRIRKDASSYSYKHRVEEWARSLNKTPTYISNGAFIAAAVGLGRRFRLPARRGPNVYFNFSKGNGL
jgi:hypothetical protein